MKCTEINVSVVKASSVEHVKKNIVYDSYSAEINFRRHYDV